MRKFFTLTLFFVVAKVSAQQCMYIGGGVTGTLPFIVNQNDFGAHQLELDYKYRLGYAFNVSAGANFHDNIGLHIEAGYAKMGQVYEDKFANSYYPGTHTKDIKLDYINFAAAFKCNTYAYKTVQFEALIGPQIGILSKSSFNYTVAGASVPYPLQDAVGFNATYPAETDYKNFFNKLDVGILFQAGLNMNFTESLVLNVGMRSYYALTDLNSEKYAKHDKYAPSRNFFGGLHLGLRWNFLTYEDFPIIDRYR